MVFLKEIKILFRGGGSQRLLISNISWQGLERGSRVMAGVFTGILLASYLGPGPLGIYSYALSFVMLFAPIISLGYDGYLARDIILEKDKPGHILGTSAFLRLGGSIIAISLIWLYTYFQTSIQPETRLIIRVMSLSFLLYPFDVFDIWFRSKMKSKLAAISNIIALVFINGLKLVFIYFKAPLEDFVWLYVSEFALDAIIQLILYLKTEPGRLKKWAVSKARAKFVMMESWPLLISSFSYMIYSRIDQIMIGNMIDNESVGIFSAAGKISDIPIALILVLNSAIYPFQAGLFKNDMEKFNRQYSVLTQVYTLFSYAMLLVVILYAGYIMRIFPHSFAAGAAVLQINFVGLIFVFNSGLRNSWLSLTGNQRFLLYSTISSAILNIILNFYLIPRFGIIGAAWASTVSEFVSLFLMSSLYPKVFYAFKNQVNSLLLLNLFKK